MRRALIIFILISLTSTSMFASDDSKIGEYGPNQSSIISDKEFNILTLKKKFTSKSTRGTSWITYPLYGGEMTSIAIDPNNPQIVYAGTRDAGVFKTADGGTSWVPSRNNLTFYPIRSLAINPDNSGIIYVGTDYDGVWKSLDSGATWFKSSNGLDESMIVFYLIIDPDNPEIIYAELVGALVALGDIGNIYKSKDGGVSWAMSDTGIPRAYENCTKGITSLAIDINNSAILYAGADSAFQSIDSGKTWFPIDDSLTYSPLALAVDPHHSGQVGALTGETEGNYYIYNGSYWQLKSAEYEYANDLFPAYLYFHPSDTSIIYSAGEDFAKSVDGGVHWNKNSEFGSNVCDIAFHSSYPDTIFAATDIEFDADGGVFKSTDQGENWNECSNGITATVIKSVEIDPQNSNRIYLGGGNGFFYRSEDGGTTWYKEFPTNSSEITDIAVDPQNSAYIYLTAFIGFYKSTDYGDNFLEKNGVEAPYCIAVNPLSTNTIYVGSKGGLPGENGVYKSSDYGETWVQKDTTTLPRITSGIPPIVAIAIDPNDTSIVWIGTQSGIVKSSNGGDSWEVKGLSEDRIVNSIAINPNNSNEILAGAADTRLSSYFCYIYKSIDGGETWVEKDTLLGSVMDIKYDFRNTQYVYAATLGYGLLRSSDGGETWYDYSNGIFYPLVYSIDIAQGDSVLLAAGTYGSGAYYIHPELSGIEEQKKKSELSFLRESSIQIYGISNLIQFNLPKAGMVSLKLYDIIGREVTEILNEHRPEGKNEVTWYAKKIPAGIYFYNLEFEGKTESKKVTFIK